jgi:hypothetical protein
MLTTGEKTVKKMKTPPTQIIQKEGRTRVFIDRGIKYIRSLLEAQQKTLPYNK